MSGDSSGRKLAKKILASGWAISMAGALIGCDIRHVPFAGDPPTFVCDKGAYGDFVVACARAANPMSDEEGEDLVRQCGFTGRDIYCTVKNPETLDWRRPIVFLDQASSPETTHE